MSAKYRKGGEESMITDLVPKRFFSVPSISSFWDDDENWLTAPTMTNSGLSVSEDDKSVYVEAAVPGIDPDNIEVTYQDGYVWIHGETKEEEKDKKRKYYRQSAQSFSYRVAIPSDVDHNVEPEAVCKNGVMTVTFAKSQEAQPKKISVKKQ